MTKLLFLALGALLLVAAPAGAISVSFLPASVDAGVGGEISFDVVVGDLAGESVGSYDLDLSFDASKLAFASFEFGDLLGGPVGSIQSSGAAAGVLDLAEVSLLLPAQLDALQGDASLFTRADEVEEAWTIVDPVVEAWADAPPPEFPNYDAGTWGPAAADELPGRDGRRWRRF